VRPGVAPCLAAYVAVGHNHGVVHGDTALRNIVRDDATGSVKLIDLGNMYKPEDRAAFSSESAQLEQVLMRLN
jgi:tRNA A-37 threonylcarbamoyl transferase component Bud32